MFPSNSSKTITQNRIHHLQLRNHLKTNQKELVNERVVDGELKPNRNRRLFLKKYDEVLVCEGCYQGFVRQVGQNEQAAQHSSHKSRHWSVREDTSVPDTSLISKPREPSTTSQQKPYYTKPQRAKSTSRQVRTRTSITREELEM